VKVTQVADETGLLLQDLVYFFESAMQLSGLLEFQRLRSLGSFGPETANEGLAFGV
jgi:hypothetical protein